MLNTPRSISNKEKILSAQPLVEPTPQNGWIRQVQ